MAPDSKALGVVEVSPAGSSQHWHVARRLGGRPVLELIVRRMTDCQRLAAVAVVAADPGDFGRIRELVPSDVPVVAAEPEDLLSTFVELAGRYDAGALIRVRANYPFVDPVLIDRLATTAADNPECDYITYCSRDGRPAVHSPLAMFAEWCSVAALRSAHTDTTLADVRRDPLRFIACHPERFQSRLLRVPSELDREDVRLCIHRDEDWEFAQAIYEALGPERLDWQEIAGLLFDNPDLRLRMATSNRAEAAD